MFILLCKREETYFIRQSTEQHPLFFFFQFKLSLLCWQKKCKKWGRWEKSLTAQSDGWKKARVEREKKLRMAASLQQTTRLDEDWKWLKRKLGDLLIAQPTLVHHEKKCLSKQSWTPLVMIALWPQWQMRLLFHYTAGCGIKKGTCCSIIQEDPSKATHSHNQCI